LQADWIANLNARALAGSGALTILNLHRVSDAQGGGYVAMTPSLFEELIVWLNQRFTLVAFHDLATWVAADPDKIIGVVRRGHQVLDSIHSHVRRFK